jgi:hypothetical protein
MEAAAAHMDSAFSVYAMTYASEVLHLCCNSAGPDTLGSPRRLLLIQVSPYVHFPSSMMLVAPSLTRSRSIRVYKCWLQHIGGFKDASIAFSFLSLLLRSDALVSFYRLKYHVHETLFMFMNQDHLILIFQIDRSIT